MDILQMSFSASVMIVAVVMLRALMLHRLPKRTFLALWGAVICRLLIPFSIPSRYSFYTGLERIRQLLAARTAISVPAPGVITGDANIVTSNMPAAGEAAGGVTGAASAASVSPALAVWLIGMCACALFFIVAYLKCRREFKTSLPVDNGFISNWLRGNTPRRIVQTRQSDRIQAPLTYGVSRPVILLPKTIDWTDEAGLKVILTHEMTHIRRFDALTKLVLAAAVCAHWFNPFVWVMYALANRDIELSCDEAVVRTFGETMKSAYAMTLIALEEKKSALAPLISGFARNAIEERITAIMKIKKYSMPIIVAAVLLVVCVTVGFSTSKAQADNAGIQNGTGVSTNTSPLPDGTVSNETVNTSEMNSSETAADAWVWPVEGCHTITSAFGKRVHPVSGTTTESDHITISGENAEGARVYAALAGTVLETGFDADQGNYIVISHDNGIETSYRHLKEISVSEGDPVAAGDTIGTVGKTGTATGPCLGFCVYVDGAAVNPLDYFILTPSEESAGADESDEEAAPSAEPVSLSASAASVKDVPAEPISEEALPAYWEMGALNVDGVPYLPLVDTAEYLGYTVNVSSFKIADVNPELWEDNYPDAVEYNYELFKDGETVGTASLDISNGKFFRGVLDQIFCDTQVRLHFVIQDDIVYMPAQFFKEALDTENILP